MIINFVGPGDKVYCNYHGHFLTDDAPLLLHVQGLPDDWALYCSQIEFELAKFLFKHAEMLANQINTLLEIWATSLLKLGGNPLFTNHMDLYHVIDSMSVGTVKWENFKITYKHKRDGQDELDEQDKVIELGGPDPCQVIHNLLGHADIKDEMDFVPYQEFDATSDQRHWEDFMLGNWAWDEVDKIISDNPSVGRATLVPIILGSDKTTVSVATGQTDYYPLYLSIGNVCNTACCAHCDVVVLIGFLAMPKMFCKFKKQLFHSSLASILWSLGPAMTAPETVLFAYIADYEEQVLLSCIVCKWCLKCLAHQENLDEDALWCHCEHTELIIRELGALTLWDEYGIDGDIVPFTSGFPCVDIQRMLSLDILHQLIKGGFKDHLVDWVERYLTHTHGRSATEKILDDIDRRCQHFKQWTGNDSKGLMKVYIAAIEGYVPQDFCYLIHRNVITKPTLAVIGDALACFHSYCEVFWNAQVVATFSLPQQHAMKHCPYLICQFGMPNGLCSLITKSKHIKAVKWPYQCTNCFQALGQILVINQRLDKFAAVCADFEKHGMLRGTCLSHVLVTLDLPYAFAHGFMSRNMRDLATELNIPQLLDILCCFLQSQLQQDNHNPEDVPLDECPFYDGCICVYNSASLTFYAPSDMSGLHSMHCKHICCSSTWRNKGPHYDCVFVMTNPHVEGMLGLDVAHYLGTEYPCAIVCWFDHIGDGPDTCTGMWIVCVHNAQDITIIHIDTIYCTAHLIPVYANHQIDPASIKPNESYDKFLHYYVNKFADHHAFKIAS
ncbi:hypothetical protein F5J12DRAFT_905371 [Pisolithus orientalis]|uniref:uncharacterized protein n=1 Tax=Pisolithus orientalis TaxID=936130 RepID=UPI00222449D1|nr:uncharacterized protein F5J12DRAFT_905371 [Pisolithus orientalis]KAI6008314.1 hypothetical protein F5J12DRAFT_905371 [Pisolithus orientalis]